jgi:hypothetical protein
MDHRRARLGFYLTSRLWDIDVFDIAQIEMV